METFERDIHVPLFDTYINLIVTDNIYEERNKYNDKLGENTLIRGAAYPGLFSYNSRGSFYLFLKPQAELKVVAHEVFHATHRILEWASVFFNECNHECAALLNGYLMDNIYPCMLGIQKRLKDDGEDYE